MKSQRLTLTYSIKEVLRASVAAYDATPRTEWVQSWPGQVVLAASQVFWTRSVTLALQEGNVNAVKKLHNALLKQVC